MASINGTLNFEFEQSFRDLGEICFHEYGNAMLLGKKYSREKV